MLTLSRVLRSVIVAATLGATVLSVGILLKLHNPEAVEALRAQPLFGVSVVILALAAVLVWIRLR